MVVANVVVAPAVSYVIAALASDFSAVVVAADDDDADAVFVCDVALDAVSDVAVIVVAAAIVVSCVIAATIDVAAAAAQVGIAAME